MKVRELIERLAEADPEAVVLVFPQYADSTDGAELQDVIVPDKPWTRETSEDGKSPCEVFYPGGPQAVERGIGVHVTRTPVVLLGEELGNYRYWT
ncbi:hypothetical protein VSR69_39320 [Paraburkholderia phytofirmans]